MHHALGANDVATERSADALVAEADAENRHLAGKRVGSAAPKCPPRWGAGARRHDDAFGLLRCDTREVNGVVAHHLDLGAELAQVLPQGCR